MIVPFLPASYTFKATTEAREDGRENIFFFRLFLLTKTSPIIVQHSIQPPTIFTTTTTMDPAQLKQVEALCETLYTGMPTTGENGERITRNEAQQRLMSLQQSADNIPRCQYILDNSQSQFARLVATNSLTELITNYWNSFTVPQRIDIRNYVL
ncbi:MAG: hypothetical protein HC802_22405, partial [Caldilineaceae bacterium]|nr:hypothetical protein [Caldilineaceae bacterium]